MADGLDALLEEFGPKIDAAMVRRAFAHGWRKGYERGPKDCEQARADLGHLLAIIHSDGGHYVEKHGVERATWDANKLIVMERIALEERELQSMCDAVNLADEVSAALCDRPGKLVLNSENIKRAYDRMRKGDEDG